MAPVAVTQHCGGQNFAQRGGSAVAPAVLFSLCGWPAQEYPVAALPSSVVEYHARVNIRAKRARDGRWTRVPPLAPPLTRFRAVGWSTTPPGAKDRARAADAAGSCPLASERLWGPPRPPPMTPPGLCVSPLALLLHAGFWPVLGLCRFSPSRFGSPRGDYPAETPDRDNSHRGSARKRGEYALADPSLGALIHR